MEVAAVGHASKRTPVPTRGLHGEFERGSQHFGREEASAADTISDGEAIAASFGVVFMRSSRPGVGPPNCKRGGQFPSEVLAPETVAALVGRSLPRLAGVGEHSLSEERSDLLEACHLGTLIPRQREPCGVREFGHDVVHAGNQLLGGAAAGQVDQPDVAAAATHQCAIADSPPRPVMRMPSQSPIRSRCWTASGRWSISTGQVQ